MVALATVSLIGQAFVLNFLVVNLLVMMGLAVGIDYSLFVLSRFREERRAGREIDEAIGVAGATASRAVAVLGITVVLALSACSSSRTRSSARSQPARSRSSWCRCSPR